RGRLRSRPPVPAEARRVRLGPAEDAQHEGAAPGGARRAARRGAWRFDGAGESGGGRGTEGGGEGIVAMDVRTLMRRAAHHHAAREAVVWNERRLSFAEAWSRGLRMANALLALGLRPQERVGVLEDNSIEASDFFLGAAAANLVRVPL